MSPDLRTRLYVTRLDPGGLSHAVDARSLGGAMPAVALGGKTSAGGAEFYRSEAVQAASGGGRDGFLAVFNGAGGDPLPVRDAGAGSDAGAESDAGTGSDADAESDATAAGDGGAAGAGEDAGCSCGVAGRAGRPPGWLALALLVLATRRRDVRAPRGPRQSW